jgi:hypothetical protein
MAVALAGGKLAKNSVKTDPAMQATSIPASSRSTIKTKISVVYRLAMLSKIPAVITMIM